METLTLKDGYSRSKHPKTRTFRPMTPNEAKHATGEIYFTGDHVTFRRCRVNGAPKTWKTRPDVELPVKYGMYEAARAVSHDGAYMVLPSGGYLLVAVEENRIKTYAIPAGDPVYVYNAAFLCKDCGRDTRNKLRAAGLAPDNEEDETAYDSGDFPKGPYRAESGETRGRTCDCMNGCPNAT